MLSYLYKLLRINSKKENKKLTKEEVSGVKEEVLNDLS